MESSCSAGKFTSKLMQANKGVVEKVPRSGAKKPLEGLHTLMHVLFALCHAFFSSPHPVMQLKVDPSGSQSNAGSKQDAYMPLSHASIN